MWASPQGVKTNPHLYVRISPARNSLKSRLRKSRARLPRGKPRRWDTRVRFASNARGRGDLRRRPSARPRTAGARAPRGCSRPCGGHGREPASSDLLRRSTASRVHRLHRACPSLVLPGDATRTRGASEASTTCGYARGFLSLSLSAVSVGLVSVSVRPTALLPVWLPGPRLGSPCTRSWLWTSLTPVHRSTTSSAIRFV